MIDKRKMASAILGITLLCSVIPGAFADDANVNTTVNSESNVVYIGGDASMLSYPDGKVATVLIKKADGAIVYIDQTEINRGKFSKKLLLSPDVSYSDCTLSVNVNGEDISSYVTRQTVTKPNADVILDIVSNDGLKYIKDGENSVINIKTENKLNLGQKYKFMIAEYNKDNSLINASVTEESVSYAESYSKSVSYTPSDNTYAVKVFAWDNESGMVPMGDVSVISKKTYSADGFYDNNGDIDYTKDGSLTLAFIGGSLTAGEIDYVGTSLPQSSNTWTNQLIKYFSEKFPNKTVKAVNAGIGGTDSSSGAYRFDEHILSCNPDIVFIEFAVNDTQSGMSASGNTKYMEYMVQRCKSMAKEPIVIFVNAPVQQNKDNQRYENWLAGVEEKQTVADYYGIGSVNIYDYFYNMYQNSGSTDDFITYLVNNGYYQENNIHPLDKGYIAFSDAIEEKLNDNAKGYIKKLADNDTWLDSTDSNIYYKMFYANDDRINYFGEWELYNKENPYITDIATDKIGSDKFDALRAKGGVSQAVSSDASFSFNTSAKAFLMSYVSSEHGSEASVYIDGVLLPSKKLSCYSIFSTMYYGTSWIMLPNDGEEHNVLVKVDEPTEEKYLFRVGSITECFDR